jgi:hypothetical protein
MDLQPGQGVNRDSDGRALRMAGTTTDITALREMAADLLADIYWRPIVFDYELAQLRIDDRVPAAASEDRVMSAFQGALLSPLSGLGPSRHQNAKPSPRARSSHSLSTRRDGVELPRRFTLALGAMSLRCSRRQSGTGDGMEGAITARCNRLSVGL